MALRDEGNLDGAIEILSDIINRRHDMAGICYVMRGGLYRDRGLYTEALDDFLIAAKLKPYSQPASQNLFHSLLDHGRFEDAFSEATRFFSLVSKIVDIMKRPSTLIYWRLWNKYKNFSPEEVEQVRSHFQKVELPPLGKPSCSSDAGPP